MKEFNSQICTSREQSERLLALGLKKETADMGWVLLNNGEYVLGIGESCYSLDIPAWSLHRLIEMIYPTDIYIEFLSPVILPRENIYDYVIERIEWLIKDGYFPKEYLV